MSVSRTISTTLLVLISLLSASRAEAQTPTVEAGSWYVTPFVALSFGGDSDTMSLGVGGAAGYDITAQFGVEGELGYLFDIVGDDDEADWSVLTAGVNGLYYFPLANGMAPYATAGIGFARSALRIADASSSSVEVGFNVGGGLKAPLTDTLAVRGDIRFFRFNDAAPDIWRIYGGLSWRPRR